MLNELIFRLAYAIIWIVMKIKVGGEFVFRYGIFSLIAPEWNCEELVQLLSELGYKGIEWRVFNSKRMGDAWSRLPAFWSADRRRTSAPYRGTKRRPRAALPRARSRCPRLTSLVWKRPSKTSAGVVADGFFPIFAKIIET